MATQTPNLNLRKPDQSDRVNVATDIGGNMDLIDAAVAAKAGTVHTHTEADVTNLTTDLAAKASSASVTSSINSHKADSAGHAGFYVKLVGVGVTGSRPSAATAGAGAVYYDTTITKPVWSDGTTWRDAAGGAA